jgi:uncharacterized protein involved in type VI secretion and phage assembly
MGLDKHNLGKGIQIGIVIDNVDPEGMHRIKVKFPVEKTEKELESYWCRVLTPMAGMNRGLVILPDIGTEVMVGFATKSLQPYVLGAVYNGGEDKPEPYKNDDTENNLRVFWSRNDHMVIFDDTAGAENVSLGAQAPTRMDVTSGPIHQVLDSSQKTITTYSDGNIEWESASTISFKCKDFYLEASNNIDIKAGGTVAAKAGGSTSVSAGSTCNLKGSMVMLNSGVPASPKSILPTPPHSHPPKR